ncbi:DEAD/DEAH box helicase domain-containing protein [Persephonella hydrogeniphila]|uniref:DEAD/DEAH box helicase domain-containing protein n=1 Tax=Persephonella hydrogeniphila TaxID=198703 RepID=A0A285NL52_9AQUI|nr:DEAD/DEAH box helicase [Persephonella hydrogeniphila]SNZ10185.1 DEAD/DEAH box helicase domain-containing protein [Persephonella hydrogeniphila]
METLKYYKSRIAFARTLPEKPAKFGDFAFENEKISKFLEEKNIKLYSHQAEALSLIKDRKNIVLTTPTASGKSLVYILSVLEKIKENPYTKAVLIFPLKALARDQYGKVMDIIFETGIEASVDVYDGDTPREKRQEIKKSPPNFLITTPDMLNTGIIPYHTGWSLFFEDLDFVVLDEIHAYRGILGSHVSNIIRRLKRVVSFYRTKKPVFITNSATIHNPSEFASKLIGEKVHEISESGAPLPEREIQIFKGLKSLETAELVSNMVIEDVSTIVFVDSRKEAEILALRIKDILRKKGREDLVEKVSPYRSGYTPAERREIEFKLLTRNILAVISTSALEMGIDIGDLESCVLVGYPGTLAQLWQRFGRAGRRDKKAYNILIPKRNALDQYFVKNPEELFERKMEEPIINPKNRYILKKHIPVMAFELPIKINELSEEEKEVARELYREKKLRFSNNKLYASKQEPFSIRSAGDSYSIVETVSGRIVGDISEDILIYEAHPGAVYIHNGEKYIVEHVDTQEKTVFVIKSDVSYITEPLKESFIDIISVDSWRKKGKIEIFKGKVNVKTTVVGYSMRDLDREEKLKDFVFEPEGYLSREFETIAFWWTMPEEWEKEIIAFNTKYNVRLLNSFIQEKGRLYTGDYIYSDLIFEKLLSFRKNGDSDAFDFVLRATHSLYTKMNDKEKERYKEYLKRIREKKNAFLGALHGVEHALIGIYPLYAMNDRWDIGGLSTPFFPETGKPTIFIYDGYEGGVGYSDVGFNRLEEMIKSTYKTISKCGCISGCPSCIYSPKCGNSNDYLDKTASIILSNRIMKELGR